MTVKTIGGSLDYAALARLNRPHDVETMRAAVHELANRGMDDYEIARACEQSVEAVRRILGDRRSNPSAEC